MTPQLPKPMPSLHTTEHLKQIIETQSLLALAGFDLQTFMNTVVDRMLPLTQATGAVVELVEGDQMVYKAASGSVAPYIGVRLDKGSSLSGLCVRDSELKISTDTSADPRVDATACQKVGAASMVVVPLLQRSETVGVLKVLSDKINAFDDDDIATLQLVAGLLGNALGQQLEIEQRKKLEEALLQRSEEVEERNQQLIDVLAELEHKSQQLEEKNLQAQESSRLKSEFLANMSHEIRTPMNAIVGFTDILLRTKLADSHREYLTCIRDAGRGLIALIGDILDFSKIEAGKMVLEFIDFDPVQVVEGAAQLLFGQCLSKGLSLHTYIDPAVPPVVLGDPSRLRQILINLIGNAIKFSDTGAIVVRVVLDEPSHASDTVMARFTVTDQGIGMTEVEMNKLFRPFVQADGSTTRKFGGTGLGLSISKRLVELMGGDIGVSSTKGKGSTFWFTLPFKCPAKATAKPLQSSLIPQMKDKTALIVDDDPVALEIIGSYLESWGIRTCAVGTSAEALAMLRKPLTENPLDVVITDLVMPEIDGFELAQRIHSDASIAKPPLLVMVTAVDQSYGEEALEEGFNGYLRKPIRKSQLLQCLLNIFSEQASKDTAKPLRGPSPFEDKGRASGRFGAFHDRASLSGGYAAFQDKSRTSGGYSAFEQRRHKPFQQGLILLAEDHPANQMVAELQLNELGLSTHIANNGLEVLEALETNNYQAILMDCQMPEMDGFEAARAIRNSEILTGKHVPIIAMTANAMQGDREACVAAGMDDYISKPVELEELHRVLQQWLPGDGNTAKGAAAQEPEPNKMANLSAIDIAGLVGIFGDKSVRKLLKVFLADTEQSLEIISAALKNRDAINLRETAHKIKGGCATIRAEELSSLSALLESAASSGDWLALEKLRHEIGAAYEKVEAESRLFLQADSSSK